MFMDCEHLGAFCVFVFVCYALFVMFNYYPFMLLYVLLPYCSVLLLLFPPRFMREEDKAGCVGWGTRKMRAFFTSYLQLKRIAALVFMYFVAFFSSFIYMFVDFYLFMMYPGHYNYVGSIPLLMY